MIRAFKTQVMQVLQIRFGNTLIQIKSLTKLGSDFISYQMMQNQASEKMIKSMVSSNQILIHLTTN